MMKITCRAPERGDEDTRRAEAQVDAMRRLLERLAAIGGAPANTGALLDRKDRKSLGRDYGRSLAAHLVFHTERLDTSDNEDGGVERDVFMAGFRAGAFDRDLQAGDTVRLALAASHGGRCAYCESFVAHVDAGDVVAFRPSTGYTTAASGGTLMRPGYFFLAYAPDNLHYACAHCRRARGRNAFEVIGARAPDVPVDAERPVLLDPYRDEPRDHLRFNPRNGHAYAFDLVAAFYAASRGWSASQTAAELWLDAGKIPAQRDHRGNPISRPEIDAAFRSWQEKTGADAPRRGDATLTSLDLNRPALVHSRLNHLRQLRAIAWSASSDRAGPDQRAAEAFIERACRNAAATDSSIGAYRSLGIDALQTWKARPQIDRPWIDTYDQALCSLAAAAVADSADRPTVNDDWMLMALHADGPVAGRRRLVSLAADDAVYGNPAGRRGIVQAIDWARDAGNTVIVHRADKSPRRMTLRELAESPVDAARLFERAELWIVGDGYPAFVR